jgi:hypothetical protein
MGRYPSLEIPDGQLGSFAKPRRLASIREAITWPSGPSQEQQRQTSLYQFRDRTGVIWEVSLCKPGKEAFREQRRNINDMFPRVSRGGKNVDYNPLFSGIWEVFEDISKMENGRDALELIGRYLAASAYMISYEEIRPDVWRISDAPDMVRFFEDLEGMLSKNGELYKPAMPIRAFLLLIESIALQEDVKYYTLGGSENLTQENKGRVNNLLTNAAICRFLTGKESIAWLVGGVTKNPPGVFAITQAKLREYFHPL